MPNPLFTILGIWNKAIFKIGATRLNLSDLANPATSPNPAAQYLTDIWPFVTAEALEEHPWSFAVQTVPMVPLSPVAWVTSNTYNVGTYVLGPDNNIYVCAVQNTSGVFTTDLASGYWIVQKDQNENNIAPLLIPLPLMNDGCNHPYACPLDFINPYLFSTRVFYRKETVKPPYLATPTIVLLMNAPAIASMKYVSSQLDVTQWSSKFVEAIATALAYQLCFKISEAAQYAAGLEKDYSAKLISAIAADSNTTSPDQAIADEWFLARLTGSTAAVGLGPDGNNVGFYMPGIDY
jgi:hypothetical protein